MDLRKTNNAYIHHLRNDHEKHVEIKRGCFPDESSVNQLKQSLEAASKCLFVTRTSKSNYRLLKCQRDKIYHKSESGIDQKREPKSNQYKLSASCPSFFSVSKTSSEYMVEYLDYHPHEISSYFQTMSCELKNEIKSMLQIGIPEKKVLKEMQELYPEYLLSYWDIENIRSTSVADDTSLHKNDKLSCQLLAERHPDSVNIVDLSDENIIIVIQTQYQRELLSSYDKESALGLDSTHCTTRYGFYLTNLHLIKSHTKNGVPVAHMLSSNETGVTIEMFLRTLNMHFNVKTTLVTDDYPAYSNSWHKVFGDFFHVQCLWHLEKNFRINLNKCKLTGIYSESIG